MVGPLIVVDASPRGLDELPVELHGTEIWVTFQNFRPGVEEKIPT